MDVLAQEKVACFHCGDEALDVSITIEDKVFCCYGCKAVYELIDSADLYQYYDNSDLKAEKVEDVLAAQRKYGFLDLPKVSRQLIRYQDDERSMVRFYLSGIHCSSCIYLLEHLPKLNPSVMRSEVNFVRKEVTITFDHDQISLKELAVMLSGLGYPPTINLDSLDQTRKRTADNNIGIKIAIAGFCFGNSMLISLPEYLDVGYQLDHQFKVLFGILNIVLAIPVVFYAASDYFISSWKSLKHRYLNIDVPISLGVSTLFIRSLLEIIYQTGPGYMDSLAGLVFFLLLGKWYQGKTYQALSFDRDYTSYFPISVSRYHNGEEETVTVEDLKVGDRVLIHNQELIPADGYLVSGEGNIDYSFVTGEAQPVSRVAGENVFAGGRQVGVTIEVALTREVNNSELTQLWNGEAFGEKKHPYHQIIDRIAQYFTAVIILLALGTGIYWYMVDLDKVWNAVTAVLIIACPCALALTLPFAFGHAMRSLGSRGLYLKNANVIESISKTRAIVFDKTGTLTKSDPVSVSYNGTDLTPHENSVIKSVMSNSAHPLSKLISRHFGDQVRLLPLNAFDEVIGKGILAEIGSNVVKVGSANYLNVSEKSKSDESRVYVMLDDVYLGYFSIKSAYRNGVFDWLKQLRKHFHLHLLSGDNDSEQERLKPYFDHLSFNQKPTQKLEYIRNIDEPVMMIGDGLNDAGALKYSGVGFAVCEDIHQFSPACDGLLSSAAIKDIPGILRFSKAVINVVMVAFGLSFAYNAVGLSFAVAGQLTPVISAILMPISSVTVVGFITIAIQVLANRIFR